MSGVEMPVDMRGISKQVNTSSPNLVKWDDVSDAIGITKRYRIYVTSVLKLPREALDLVEAYDITEGELRPIVQKLKGHPDLQLKAVKQITSWVQDAEWEPSKQLVERLVTSLLRSVEANEETKKPVDASVTHQAQQFVKGMRRTLKQLSKFDDMRLVSTMMNDDELDELKKLRSQIDEILKS